VGGWVGALGRKAGWRRKIGGERRRMTGSVGGEARDGMKMWMLTTPTKIRDRESGNKTGLANTHTHGVQ